MPYVQRNAQGVIVGMFNMPQPGIATEFLAAADPAVVSFLNFPQLKYATTIGAGLAITWTTSTALNATYTIDQQTQIFIAAEMISIVANNQFTNGATTRQWPDATGTLRTVTIAQFRQLALAVLRYVQNLYLAMLTAQNGGTPTWPSSSVTINL